MQKEIQDYLFSRATLSAYKLDIQVMWVNLIVMYNDSCRFDMCFHSTETTHITFVYIHTISLY